MALILIRLVSLIIIGVGLFLWREGGLVVPIEYRNFEIEAPLHLLFVLLGLAGIIFPIGLISLLPERQRSWLESKLRVSDSNLAELQSSSPSPETVATLLYQQIRKSNRRIAVAALLLIAAVFAVTIIGPTFIANAVDEAARQKAMELIRSRGQFPKGGYDVHDGGTWQPATPAAVQ